MELCGALEAVLQSRAQPAAPRSAVVACASHGDEFNVEFIHATANLSMVIAAGRPRVLIAKHRGLVAIKRMPLAMTVKVTTRRLKVAEGRFRVKCKCMSQLVASSS